MTKQSRTSGRNVHAAIAAAMDNPDLLERWRKRAASARRIRSDKDTFDFDRMRLFAGLATKVRHGDVRLSLPLTFKLLDALEISIQFFADYAGTAAALRKAGTASTADKIASLCTFVDGWIDGTDSDQALVRDMI